MININHIIDKTFNSGAYSQLRYLYNSLNEYHNGYVKQSISILDLTGKHKIDKSFKLPYKIINKSDIIPEKYSNDDIIVYHKLMCSPSAHMVGVLRHSMRPVAVINHTYSVNKKFMKIGYPNLCISVSDHMSEALNINNENLKIVTIKNWCDVNYINSYNYELSNDDVILKFGRINGFNDIKYSKDFIKWFINADFGAPAVLDYIGSGDKLQNAKDLINKYSGNSKNTINLLGQINDDKIKFQYIKNWDAFLYHINYPEGTSMSVVESLVSGTPVICNLPGNTELIENGVNGLIYNKFSEVENFVKEIGKSGFKKLKSDTVQKSSLLTSKQWSQYYIDAFTDTIKNFQVQKYPIKLPNKNIISTSNKNIVRCDIKQNVITKSVKVNNPIKSNKYNYPVKNSLRHSIVNPVKVVNRNLNVKTENNIVYPVSGNDKFSILTASYNNERYLDDYFSYILKQSYRPLEVIFIDDLSTDGTRDKINKYKDRLIKANIDFVYHKPDKKMYCGDAYNKALELSNGSLCGVLDSDDGLVDDAVSRIVSKYNELKNVLYIWTQFFVCDALMRVKKQGFSSSPLVNRSLLLSEFTNRKRHCFSHWRTFRKTKEIPFDLFGSKLKSSVDKYMGYRLEELGIGHFYNEPLYLYRSGVTTGITISQKGNGSQRETWRLIRREAQIRRRSYKLFCHGFC